MIDVPLNTELDVSAGRSSFVTSGVSMATIYVPLVVEPRPHTRVEILLIMSGMGLCFLGDRGVSLQSLLWGTGACLTHDNRVVAASVQEYSGGR